MFSGSANLRNDHAVHCSGGMRGGHCKHLEDLVHGYCMVEGPPLY